jgi:uncharacterized protein with FMN-binding domain
MLGISGWSLFERSKADIEKKATAALQRMLNDNNRGAKALRVSLVKVGEGTYTGLAYYGDDGYVCQINIRVNADEDNTIIEVARGALRGC